jgi:FkbM family methyltransferase
MSPKIKRAIKRFIPGSWHQRWMRRTYLTALERRIYACYCDRAKDAIDIGANRGVIADVMALHSRAVIAYEPNAGAFDLLCRYSRRNVRPVRLALSDHEGTAVAHVPIVDGVPLTSHTTLRTVLVAPEATEVAVPLSTLDAQDHRDVAFIKIDVEGHESATIRGGLETLRRERPTLYVEIDQAWHDDDISGVHQLLQGLGYRLYFAWEGRLHPLADFVPERHQPLLGPGKPAPGERAGDFLCVPEGLPDPRDVLA